jgi:hypothetical protein
MFAKKGSCITTYLTKKGYLLYSLLNISQISLVFFAALVDPSSLPGPFLHFSGSPAGRLFVQRLLLTWVQFCLSTAWAVTGWIGAGAGTGASPGAETRTGPEPGTENRTGLLLYTCFATAIHLVHTGQSLAQDWYTLQQFIYWCLD